MSGADTAWAVMLKLHSHGMLRLGCALAASLLGHALLLFTPLPLSTGGEPGSAGAALSTLRVKLNLIAETTVNPVRESSPTAETVAPTEPGAAPDRTKDAPPGAQGTPDAIPLHGYYPAGRLSRMPVGIGVFDIQPPAGGDTGLGGKMTIRVWINAKGGIDSLRVLASALPAAYADAALAAFDKMRFEPGEINGVPVRSWVDIVIEYADIRREMVQPPSSNQ